MIGEILKAKIAETRAQKIKEAIEEQIKTSEALVEKLSAEHSQTQITSFTYQTYERLMFHKTLIIWLKNVDVKEFTKEVFIRNIIDHRNETFKLDYENKMIVQKHLLERKFLKVTFDALVYEEEDLKAYKYMFYRV